MNIWFNIPLKRFLKDQTGEDLGSQHPAVVLARQGHYVIIWTAKFDCTTGESIGLPLVAHRAGTEIRTVSNLPVKAGSRCLVYLDCLWYSIGWLWLSRQLLELGQVPFPDRIYVDSQVPFLGWMSKRVCADVRILDKY